MFDNGKPPKQFEEIMLLRAAQGQATSAQQVFMIYRAVKAQTALVIRNHQSDPVAYIIWAGGVKETARRFLKSGMPPANSCEWNEGKLCILIDVSIRSDSRPYAISAIRTFLRQQRAVIFARRNRAIQYLRGAGGWTKNVRALAQQQAPPRS